jgi:hypothetical protein
MRTTAFGSLPCVLNLEWIVMAMELHAEDVGTMLGKMKRSLFVAAAIVCLTPLHRALAEPTSTDESIQRFAQKKPDSGLVFIEARVFERGKEAPTICQKIWVSVSSSQAEKAQFITQDSPTFLGRASDSATYGGWAVLNEGTYIVRSVLCQGPAGINLKGPFAGFVLRKGQVLNLGRLVIEYTPPPFELHLLPHPPPHSPGVWRVEDLSAEALATLTKRAPAAFAKATKHYMTPVVVKPKPPTSAPN